MNSAAGACSFRQLWPGHGHVASRPVFYKVYEVSGRIDFRPVLFHVH
ncbi:hypothetical protein SXCC_03105 [Gluconacetobacter sp. SXCC-1]|nr:hypothetical protein SXCC_03105 [Gluconacetobacter sp. SXCC-1]